MVRLPLYLLVILPLVTLSCRKEEDGERPSVSITSPANGFALSIPDTLRVEASYRDDRIVESLTISILGPNGLPARPRMVLPVDQVSGSVGVDLVLDDERNLTGTYSLSVTANDGRNSSSDQRDLNITEAPLRLKAIFAITTPSINQVDVFRVDKNNMATLFASYLQDLNGAAIDSYNGKLYIAGGAEGDFLAVDANTGNQVWSLGNNNIFPAAYFTNVLQSDEPRRVYVSRLIESDISGYNSSGMLEMNAQSLFNYKPLVLADLGDRLISEQKENSTEARRLVVYNNSTGALLEEQDLEVELISIQGVDNSHVLLFGEKSGAGTIEYRDLSSATGIDLQGGLPFIQCVGEAPEGVYFIGLAGAILRYQHPNNSLVDLTTSTGANYLAYDRANGTLLVAQGSELRFLNASSGALNSTVGFPGAVRLILPYYNR
jgi:hypothetical protein